MVRRKSTAVKKKTEHIMKNDGKFAEKSPEKSSHTKTSSDLKQKSRKVVKQKSRKINGLQSDKDDSDMLYNDEIHRSFVTEIRESLPEPAKINRQTGSSNVLREIKKYQKSVNLLIPRASFARLCRQILLEYAGIEMRIRSQALECLQESAEMYLVQMFEDAYLCALHARRQTLMNRDIRLVRRIGGRRGYYI